MRSKTFFRSILRMSEAICMLLEILRFGTTCLQISGATFKLAKLVLILIVIAIGDHKLSFFQEQILYSFIITFKNKTHIVDC